MNKYIYGSLVIAMVAVLGMGVVFASGADGFGNRFMKSGMSEEDKVVMQKQMEDYRAAIETDDYAAWEAIMLEKVGDFEDKINRETFDEIVVRHSEMAEFREAVEELKASGEFSREAFEELKAEQGIEGPGFGKKMHGGFGGMHGEGSHGGLGGMNKGRGGSELGSRAQRCSGGCPFAEE